tara:strand:+ start:36 stop:851 length:816 start_codon:yes stop_codon:yes gene_type:complete
MKKIKLISKRKFDKNLDLRNLHLLLEKISYNSILNIKVLFGNKQTKLGNLFEIQINDIAKDEIEIEIFGTNHFCDYVGWKWGAGILKIHSNVGSFLGAKMTGGNISVMGSAEHHVGSEMTGGNIIVKKNTLDFLGSPLPGGKVGMGGGEIVVMGKARNYLALNMRKGLIYVNSEIENFGCNNMIAGTVVLRKRIGENFGLGMKRGTIFTSNFQISKNNFQEVGFTSFSFLEILNNYINKKYKLKIFKNNKLVNRYIGDRKINGNGEIFVES